MNHLIFGQMDKYTRTPGHDAAAVDEWEIPVQKIVLEEQLGEGTFGQVAKGFIRGPILGSHTMNDCLYATVALKFLKGQYLPVGR